MRARATKRNIYDHLVDIARGLAKDVALSHQNPRNVRRRLSAKERTMLANAGSFYRTIGHAMWLEAGDAAVRERAARRRRVHRSKKAVA